MNNDYEKQTIEYENGEVQEEDVEQGNEINTEETPQPSAKKKKKRKKKHYFLKLLILIAFCVALYFFLHSSLFNVKSIKVSGSTHFTAEQIQKTAGLKTGENLFDFSAGDCEDRLEENPYIQEAQVSRKLPSSIEIHVKERQEAAVIQMDQEYVVIDEGGFVLQIAEKAPRFTLLTDITITDAKEGEVVRVEEKATFQQMLRLVKAMQEADLFFKRISISGNTVSAYATDKLWCTGTASNLLTGMKEGNLKTVLYDLYKKKITKGIITIGDDQYYAFSKKIK